MGLNARGGSNAAAVSSRPGRLKPALLASAGLLFLAHPALAQQGAPSDGENDVDEVVVTGSRIADNGFQQPTPVTVVGEQEIQRQMPPTIATYLTELPSFGPTASSRAPGAGVAGGGAETINLRALGSSRTLTLLDNRRVVPSSPGGAIDTLTMPSSLIKRVEIVTGGASAAWGADAVAGVVNFVLNHDYEGVGLNAQAGISERGDDKQASFNLTFGRKFMDGRIRFIADLKYSYSPDAVEIQDRGWWRNRAAVTNPRYTPTNGQPQLITVDWAAPANVSAGGVIASGPLRGIQFVGPTGTPVPYNFGNLSGQVQWGGDLDLTLDRDVQLTAALKYGTAFTHVDFDLTDDITVYGELGYNESHYDDSGYFYYRRLGNLTIRNDNPFLDASVRQQMAANNITSFNIGLTFDPGAPPHSENVRKVWRGVVGIDGRFGDNWKWGAYFQHGEAKARSDAYGNVYIARFNLAVDAVRDPATGAIVCRSTLTDRTNGCVPLNVLGNGVASEAAKKYVQGIVPFQDTHVQLDVLSAEASGSVFTLPAGDVSVAFGADYYEEKASSTQDDLSAARQFATGNFQPFSGSRNVKEAFAETSIPIFKDLPFVKSLELNAAGRLTDYSTSGRVETWKLGATYQVTDDLRFRITRSRDIRAPTLNDLYSLGSSGTQAVFDPQQNRTAQVFFIARGNPDLKPEDAKTTTAGIVYSPSFLSGLQLSIDYYKISIDGAIATVGSAQTVQRCFADEPDLCRFIIRDASGAIVQVLSAPQNIDKLTTSGVDFEVDYRRAIGPGELTLRALANYTPEYNTTQNGVTRKRAGYVGTNGNEPFVRGTVTATYTQGPLAYTLRSRLIGATKLDKYWKSGVNIDENKIPAHAVFDLTVVYDTTIMGVDSSLTFTVNNLFDRDPIQVPVLPDSGIYSFPALSNRYDLYDPFGRRFRIGYRARW
jgi:outer membrane receptor protein involved in Fe transport